LATLMVTIDWQRNRCLSATLALAATALALAGCGGSGNETAARQATNATAQSSAPDLDRFLMRKGEEPGFRPGALPGATPTTRKTITGVDAIAKEFGLAEADAQRLRTQGYIATRSGPIRGPQTAGVTTAELYRTAAGAKQSQAHELRREVINGSGSLEGLRYFSVPGVPGARGWSASDVANVIWVQGRCMMILGNQGPGRLTARLSTGAQAIYKRTNGECP
jgi:hypothetical protein